MAVLGHEGGHAGDTRQVASAAALPAIPGPNLLVVAASGWDAIQLLQVQVYEFPGLLFAVMDGHPCMHGPGSATGRARGVTAPGRCRSGPGPIARPTGGGAARAAGARGIRRTTACQGWQSRRKESATGLVVRPGVPPQRSGWYGRVTMPGARVDELGGSIRKGYSRRREQ